jgi:hypothetical protein
MAEAATADIAALPSQVAGKKYVINVKQITKFVKEGMHIGVNRSK